jgi:hypothetical protein
MPTTEHHSAGISRLLTSVAGVELRFSGSVWGVMASLAGPRAGRAFSGAGSWGQPPWVS